ncbi:unnamed protein product [Ambrosiozyma monospora]|uniref:Unnamed protein product n=1 Tax=Ambrosiozyma monospora TaxID=43982 RepID=A0ACB5SZD4_AMBMO|nr:unnamed protein product [Ambrosiozyma monospora]
MSSSCVVPCNCLHHSRIEFRVCVQSANCNLDGKNQVNRFELINRPQWTNYLSTNTTQQPTNPLKHSKMSQSVTISYNFKTFTCKTPPAMLLSQVVEKGCSYFGLLNPELYSLKKGNTTLDLSLPIRFANLPQGSKLQLVKDPSKSKSNSATAGKVTIKLMIVAPQGDTTFKPPAPSDLVEKFFPQDTLSQLLGTFEKKISQKLIERNGYETSVQMMTRTLSIPEELNTTLASLGLNSGNHSLRVRFKSTTPIQTPPAITKANQSSHIETSTDVSKKATNVNSYQTAIKQKEHEQQRENHHHHHHHHHHQQQQQEQEQQQEKQSNEPLPLKTPSEPKIMVYKPELSAPINNREEEDSTYEMSISQAKLYQSILSKRAGATQFTKFDPNANKKASPEFTECIVRVRFPDQTTVQLTMPAATSTLRDLYHVLIREVLLLTPDEEEAIEKYGDEVLLFQLAIPYPSQLVLGSRDDLKKQLLKDCQFGHRSLLVFQQLDSDVAGNKKKNQYIKSRYLTDAKTLNELDEVKLSSTESQIIDKDDDGDVKMGSTSISHEDEDNKFKGPSSGGLSTKKIPKWLKLGKK